MRRLRSCTIAVALALAGGAAAQPSPQAIADQAGQAAAAIGAATPPAPWGCEVLLCLANPQGPTAVAQCVAPIQRLWAHLRSGRPFPACPMAQGPDGGAYAEVGHDPYDPCPEGTVALPTGQRTVARPAPGQRAVLLAGIGEGEGAVPDAVPPAPKVCVGPRTGSAWVGDGADVVQVDLHEPVVVLPPAASPAFVDLWTSQGGAWRRIRRVRF